MAQNHADGQVVRERRDDAVRGLWRAVVVLGFLCAFALGTCRVVTSFGGIGRIDCGSNCEEELARADASRQWMSYGAGAGLVAAGIGIVALIATRRRTQLDPETE